GYVLGEGFFEASISTIAAPVRDETSRVVAALGATVPAAHFDAGRIDELVQRVRATADELSARLNYRPTRQIGATDETGESRAGRVVALHSGGER
ncbi:MAG: IclR family transcriptional regulator C-terminal domain-containing protein, partial [Caldimonas sp.]